MTSKDFEIALTDRSSGSLAVDNRKLTDLVNAALALLREEYVPDSVQELSILLTTDSHIQELNRDFRGKDKPTDVLSFSQLEGDQVGPDPISLGDIVISMDTMRTQAKELEVPPEQELLRLLVHGLLHLLGFDHEDVPAEEVKRMQEKEDFLQSALSDQADGLLKGE